MNYLQSSYVVKNPHDRVRNHSPKSLNEAIDRKTIYNIEATILKGPSAVRERLNALDKEWDIDRAIMLLFSGVVFTQLAVAMKKKNSNWLVAPLIQLPLLFLYATLGWCPPAPVFRKLGFRTRFEIQAEREELLNSLYFEDQEDIEKDIEITEWDIYESI
ncbi:MAG: hypothetical protein H7281_16980 [Bacteriovorax sp.]|nr:hypothetical protein [Bacteriovorax sp.]